MYRIYQDVSIRILLNLSIYFLLFQVRFTLYRERPLHERQAKFQQGCREGHVEMVSASVAITENHLGDRKAPYLKKAVVKIHLS